MKKFILTILLLLLLAIPSTSYASLTFTGASTQVVNYGSGASLDNHQAGTYLFWIMPSGTGRTLFNKGSANDLKIVVFSGGTFKFEGWRNAGTSVVIPNALVANFSAYATNKWLFVAVVWDAAGANSDQKLFMGDLTSPPSEPSSYASQLVGSGTMGNDSAYNAYVGNQNLLDNSFGGRIAWAGVWNRALTIGEIKAQQFRPHKTTGNVLYSWLGFNGTGTQPDWSGNNNSGTVTGATVSANVPLGPLRR